MSYHCGLPQGPCGLPRGLMCGSPRGPREQTLRPKFSNSDVFLALPTETSFTTPHYYPKYEVWAIEFFCGRIPLMLVCAPREWSVQDSNKQARQRTGGPSFVENASVYTLFSLGTLPRSPAIDKHGNSTPPLASFLVPKPDVFTKCF